MTGGIGSGKSTVSKLFQNLGAAVIDADIVAHQLVEPGQPALTQLTQAFSDILNQDGSLNRSKLAGIIFSDANQKKRLEKIMHPLVYAQIESEIQKLNHDYCILAVPLLLESGQASWVDRILVIDCPLETQLERVKKRDNLSIQRINRIIDSQMLREKRLSYADDIIDNSKSASQLAEQVKNLHNLYCSLGQH